jgi:hypothetical protein
MSRRDRHPCWCGARHTRWIMVVATLDGQPNGAARLPVCDFHVRFDSWPSDLLDEMADMVSVSRNEVGFRMWGGPH